MPVISRFFGRRNWWPTGSWRGRSGLYIASPRWSEIVFLHVKDARYVRDYVIWLRFNDGAEGEIDLEKELDGEVFGPLKNLDQFRRFKVDPEVETIVWENGADLAPEFLYENMRVLA
jgi:hypothetical protein